MAIEINNIPLRQVHHITTHEGGGHVMQQVPGMAGDIAQDLGRAPLWVQIDGIFYGEEIDKELAELRTAFLNREPVEFLAQITGQAYAAKVLIDQLQVNESGEYPNQYTYQLTVAEYIEPPTTNLDTGVTDTLVSLEAAEITGLMEIPDMLALGSIPELSNPAVPLKGVLSPMQEASKALVDASQGLSILFGTK